MLRHLYIFVYKFIWFNVQTFMSRRAIIHSSQQFLKEEKKGRKKKKAWAPRYCVDLCGLRCESPVDVIRWGFTPRSLLLHEDRWYQFGLTGQLEGNRAITPVINGWPRMRKCWGLCVDLHTTLQQFIPHCLEKRLKHAQKCVFPLYWRLCLNVYILFFLQKNSDSRF